MTQPNLAAVFERVHECTDAAALTRYQYELLEQAAMTGTFPFEGTESAAAYAVMAFGAAGFEQGAVAPRLSAAQNFHIGFQRLRGSYGIIHGEDILVAGTVRKIGYKATTDGKVYSVIRRVRLDPAALAGTDKSPKLVRRGGAQFFVDLHTWPQDLVAATDTAKEVKHRDITLGDTAISWWFTDQTEERLAVYSSLATLVSVGSQRRHR